MEFFRLLPAAPSRPGIHDALRPRGTFCRPPAGNSDMERPLGLGALDGLEGGIRLPKFTLGDILLSVESVVSLADLSDSLDT